MTYNQNFEKSPYNPFRTLCNPYRTLYSYNSIQALYNWFFFENNPVEAEGSSAAKA